MKEEKHEFLLIGNLKVALEIIAIKFILMSVYLNEEMIVIFACHALHVMLYTLRLDIY